MHISHFKFFFFFLLMTLLALYFIFILDLGNDVRQKSNPSNLFKFKISHEAAETTCNIKNTFGPGTANKCTVQGCFKKFCKQNESLEDKRHSGWPSEVDSNQLKGSWKLNLLQLQEKMPKNSRSTILQSFDI